MEDRALKTVVGTTAHAPLSLVDPTARVSVYVRLLVEEKLQTRIMH